MPEGLTRFLTEAFTLVILAAGLTELIHLMIVVLALIDPSRLPQ